MLLIKAAGVFLGSGGGKKSRALCPAMYQEFEEILGSELQLATAAH